MKVRHVGEPPPMRPGTATRRSGHRLFVNLGTILLVGAITLAASFWLPDRATWLLLAVDVIGYAALLSVQFFEDRRDRDRVAVYYRRMVDLDDDPETDPDII